MGGWKLEVGKMALYMTFPVALFHYFNQPQYFEEWVTKKKRELFPPEDTPSKLEFKAALKEIREKQEAQMLKAMEGR